MVLSMYSAVFSPVSTVPLDKVTGPLISTLQILEILLAIYAVRILLDFIRQEPSATPR